MAAYIPVPRDLTRVKTKVFFNLTKRQLLCFGAAALIGVPIFFLVKATGNVSLAALSMMIVMLPLFFLAMYEKDGQPLEVVVEHFIQTKFVRPKVRPYQTDNYYDALMRQYKLEKETNYKMSSPKMKIVQKNAPPLTNSIQMLRKTSEGDGESKTTKPEYALVFKNCSI